MADVELVAIKDFSYSTRRLKAGDSFTVDGPMSRVLIGIKAAELARQVGKVAAPPKALVQKVVAAAKPVAAMSTASTEAPKTRRRRRSAAKK